jgi:dTDP-4-amino-4,6-dideoxygalactose transaminase
MSLLEERMDAVKIAGTRIPAQRYDFPDDDVDTITRQLAELLRSRAFLTMGERCAEFEARFAAFAGVPHAVAVSSGTGALEIILRAIGVEGAEVVVPTNTFAATAYAVLHAGGIPVFADCGDDLAVNPEDVERRITTATRAVIAVHIGGLVSGGVLRLRELCRSRGLALVEDAAHACGSALNGFAAGSFGDAAAFSFFSTKVMTTGEGGMITTADGRIATAARLLRDQAKVEGRNLHEVVGSNWRLTELQAIVGLTQLARVPEFVAGRERVARIYDRAFAGAEPVRPVTMPAGARPNWYKYLLLTRDEATAVASRLAPDRGVTLGGTVYDVPCHQQPVFARYNRGPLPVAEHFCRHHVCPPIYPSLTDDEAQRVADAVLEAVR